MSKYIIETTYMVFGKDFEYYVYAQNRSMSYFNYMSGTEAVRICIMSEHDNMVTLRYSLPFLGVIDYFGGLLQIVSFWQSMYRLLAIDT
jgi:hypothetical protein